MRSSATGTRGHEGALAGHRRRHPHALGIRPAVASRAIDPRCRGSDREDLVAAGVVGLVHAGRKLRRLSAKGLLRTASSRSRRRTSVRDTRSGSGCSSSGESVPLVPPLRRFRPSRRQRQLPGHPRTREVGRRHGERSTREPTQRGQGRCRTSLSQRRRDSRLAQPVVLAEAQPSLARPANACHGP